MASQGVASLFVVWHIDLSPKEPILLSTQLAAGNQVPCVDDWLALTGSSSKPTPLYSLHLDPVAVVEAELPP